ncbi:MAG: hypothetical protein ACK5L8_05430 [Marinicella pacifica]|jgi:hypothetical protein
MSTWNIKLTPAHHNELNDILSLNRTDTPFRNWFGALAGEIYKSIRHGLNLPLASPKTLNKTEAQHILIEAAMVQQQCLQHYRVYQDLAQHNLTDLALHDVLLFIRMCNYHPGEHDLLDYQKHSHVIESTGHLKILLNQLEEQRLIQTIRANHRVFYDKNPYPHCHLFDTETGRISDYDCHLNTLHNKRFKRIPHVGIECG